MDGLSRPHSVRRARIPHIDWACAKVLEVSEESGYSNVEIMSGLLRPALTMEQLMRRYRFELRSRPLHGITPQSLWVLIDEFAHWRLHALRVEPAAARAHALLEVEARCEQIMRAPPGFLFE